MHKSAARLSSSRLLGPLPLLAFGSGVAALIYEITWFQSLELVVGASAVSLSVLLATFMGGMCIGSLALPRILSNGRDPLRAYAAIEIAIGILGLLELVLMPIAGRAYATWEVGQAVCRALADHAHGGGEFAADPYGEAVARG